MAKSGSKSGAGESSKVWSVMSLAASVGAGIVVKKGLNTAWKAATGKNPPANPADPDTAMAEAVAWAVASGTAIQLCRMLASRRAAVYYTRSTGHLPPGLEKDDQDPSKPTPRS